MTIEELTIEQVVAAIKHIESYYTTYNGAVDLLLMVNKDPHIYSTWRKLRERVRQHGRSVRDANRAADRG